MVYYIIINIYQFGVLADEAKEFPYMSRLSFIKTEKLQKRIYPQIKFCIIFI